MNPNNRALVYTVLTIIGVIFIVYSIKLKNYILLAAAVLFAFVSADNIFCSLGKNNKNKITILTDKNN